MKDDNIPVFTSAFFISYLDGKFSPFSQERSSGVRSPRSRVLVSLKLLIYSSGF